MQIYLSPYSDTPRVRVYAVSGNVWGYALLCHAPKSFQAICQADFESRPEKKGGVWCTPSHFTYKLGVDCVRARGQSVETQNRQNSAHRRRRSSGAGDDGAAAHALAASPLPRGGGWGVGRSSIGASSAVGAAGGGAGLLLDGGWGFVALHIGFRPIQY
jgi:hypothetical protein